MDKLKELRMTLVILVIGTFFISGCFFNNKHTVTFKTNGGSEVKNVTVKNGSKLENVSEPKKDGYVFDGWYLEGEEFDFNSKIDDDMTLVAKWIKVDVNKDTEEEVTTETTTESTKTTKKTTSTKTTSKANATTKKTTKKTTQKTTKKVVVDNNSSNNTPNTGTTTGETVNKPTPTPEEPSSNTVTPTAGSETTEPTNTLPTVNIDPVPKPSTEPTTEPTTEKIPEPIITPTNLKIEVKVEEVTNEDGTIEEHETIVVSKTADESNVVGNVASEELIKKLVSSDMKTWIVTSGNGWNYIFDFKDDEEVNSLELKGDNKVSSFTVKLADTSLVETESVYLFNYDEVEEKWYVQHPTVKVSYGLDVRYFNNLQTAINNARKGERVSILKNMEVTSKITIPRPMIIDGEGNTLTKTGDYLFDIENIGEYVLGDELVFENFDFMAESLIYRGSSTFDKIVINASEGVFGGIAIDNDYQLILNNTNFYSKF